MVTWRKVKNNDKFIYVNFTPFDDISEFIKCKIVLFQIN